MKTVLHVHSGNLYGGIERMLVTIARTQTADYTPRHTFALCTEGRLGTELRAAHADVVQLGPTRARNPLSVFSARTRLRHHIARTPVHAMVCHGTWAMALFGPIAKRAGIKLVLFLHDRPTQHWLERWSRRTRPDVLICNSAHTSAAARAYYSAMDDVVIHPPMLAPPPAETATRLRIRAQLNAHADEVVIVQVSRLEAWKGHARLVQALRGLRDVSGWTLWIAGGAQRPAEKRLLGTLRNAVRESDLEGRIRFLGERDDVPKLLQAADIFCQPNTGAEPFGLSIVEAMAAGLPVVTTDLGGAAQIVGEHAGVLVPPGDTHALADAIHRLIMDPELRFRLGSAGPARAASLCDAAARMRDFAAAVA